MSSVNASLRGLTHITITVSVVVLIVSTGVLMGCRDNSTHGTPAKSGIDAEAQMEAEKYWGALLTKCGGTIYGKDNRRAVDQIYEFRDLSTRIKPRVLSDADRMNGIEWSGDAYLDSKTSRVLTGDKWGVWRDGSIYLNSEKMEKVHGRWKFGLTEDSQPPLRTFDCSELP